LIIFFLVAGRSGSDEVYEDLGSNLPKLKTHVETIAKAIAASHASLPYGIRFIAACIKDMLLKKNKDMPVRTSFCSALSLLEQKY